MLTSPKGIFLFDSSGRSNPAHYGSPESSVHRPLRDPLPRFSPETTIPTEHQAEKDHSLREAFLSKVYDREFIDILLQDPSILLWVVMNSALGAWLDVFAALRRERVPEDADIEGVNDDWRLSKLLAFRRTMQENMSMLKEILSLLQSRGCATLKCGQGTRASGFMDSLTIDYRHLVEDAEKEVGLLTQRINTFAAIRSIHESGKAIEQSDAIG